MVKPSSPPRPAAYWQQLRKPLELEVARGCPDTAIAGAGIGIYAKLWSQRLLGGGEEDSHLALSIARGLRDYATMPVAERRRRAIAAIDLLRKREATERETTPAPPPARAKAAAPSTQPRTPRKRAKPAENILPVGHELLEMPIDMLAPRAKWPKVLADKLNIYTVRDLLYHIPRDWVETIRVADLRDDSRAAIIGTVTDRECDVLRSKQTGKRLYKYILTVNDGTGTMWVTAITSEPERPRGGKRGWNPQKLQFSPGTRIFAMGRVERTGKLVEMHMEDVYELGEAEAIELHAGTPVPLYPLTEGVFQNQVHRAVLRALAALGAGEVTNALIDPLPANVREQYGLLSLLEALREIHLPRSPLRHEQARKRLAFEEFLVPQLAMAQRRWTVRHQGEDGLPAAMSMADLSARLAPFAPTPAQQRVLEELETDLRDARPMNRLLQGDVGSGKTFVAACALAFTASAGAQAAIMAPTEILAEQLYLVLTHLLAPIGIAPVLLTGSTPAPERKAALAGFAAGSAKIAVGTHALIQEQVEFRNLALAIVDEQHRFGVLQRATLRNKGKIPNTLVMTATPIPRTLSLTAYGDLDVSVLDGMPPGRHPVATRWMPAHDLPTAYRSIREQITAGHQAYILCPLVEQSEMLQANAATEMAEELQRRIFPDLRVGLLHGRMKPAEKDAAMEAFRAGQTHILACTTVVEVGVDVPNATVILIHNAEHFGLAQLHQLRGRVGRSEHPSICLLVTQPRFNPADIAGLEETPARKRLCIMLNEQDGFAIAEADLEIRGPGEYLGARQSGMLECKIGSLTRDGAYLELARQAAQAIVADDHELANPTLADLRQRVQQFKARVDQFRE